MTLGLIGNWLVDPYLSFIDNCLRRRQFAVSLILHLTVKYQALWSASKFGEPRSCALIHKKTTYITGMELSVGLQGIKITSKKNAFFTLGKYFVLKIQMPSVHRSEL